MDLNRNMDTSLIRFFSGEATELEKRKIEEWLSQSKMNKIRFMEYHDIWLAGGIKNNTDQYNREEALARLKEKIKQKERGSYIKISYKQIWQYAAVLVLLISLPFIFSYLFKNSADDYTTIHCDYGDRARIVLPDGTKVQMNSGTTLSFNNHFKQDRRDVLLEGEAFFVVAEDKSHPFTVNASGLEIVVLGTEFNVSAYPEHEEVSATLVKGKLMAKSNSQHVLIKPDQNLIFSKNDGEMRVEEMTDLSPKVGWTEGRMVFRNEPINELVPKLERWFDVDILMKDKAVGELRFTGTLERENILEAMEYFDLSPYFEYQIEGNKIILKSSNP